MIQFAEYEMSEIIKEIKSKLFIEVEASGRHIHLSKKDKEALFGKGYQLTKAKDLSQPGQYACNERVSVIGPKGILSKVVVLGPEREETQIEITMTDAVALGIKAPIRQSGDVQNTEGAVVSNGENKIRLDKGVIIAKRHIHLTPEDAQRFHVQDGEIVKVKVFGERPLIFDDTVVRVNKNFRTFIHIDYDEANACGYKKGVYGLILK